MTWISTDFVAGSYGTPGGTVRLVTPEGSAETLEIPDGAFPILERVSMASVVLGNKSRCFLNGGLSDNMVVTENRYLLRNFIAAPTLELVTSAAPASHQVGIELVAAASGLSGSCIFYLRFYDSLHDRRSPFSGPSPAQTMTGTLVPKFRNVPSGPNPYDICVDQVEVWVWRNGITDDAGNPDIRRLASRDIGTSTFTVTETVEGLAETEQALQPAPRCRFNASYHSRLFMAGDERHPERLYFSPINRYDDFTGLYVNTLNGEAITGIVRVRDSLVILCAFSSYTLVGYSNADIAMEVLEPDIGCVTHFGIAKVGQLAIIPTHQGLAVSNGTSLKLLPGDYQKFWTNSLKNDQRRFQLGFGINDKVSAVYKFYEESITGSVNSNPTFGVGRYWVWDYGKDGLSSEITVVPKLSFDTHTERPKCAAMLAVPGAASSELYTSFYPVSGAGKIVRENVWNQADVDGSITVIIEPAIIIGEFGGGPWDGLTLEEMWFFIYNYGLSPASATVMIQNGNEFCVNPVNSTYLSTEALVLGLPASDGGKGAMNLIFGTASGLGDKYFPQTINLPSQNLVGEGFAPRITVVNPTRLIYRGHGMCVAPGKKFAHPVLAE